MVRDPISITMKRNILEIGFKINKRGMVRKSGQMARNMLDSIKMVRKRVLVNSLGKMGRYIRESFMITSLTDKVFISGLIIGNLTVSGLITKCMGKELLHGKMDASTSESIKKIKRKDMVNSSGQMVKSIKVSGKTENNMAMGCILVKTKKSEKENGKMVRGLNGFETTRAIAKIAKMRNSRKMLNKFLIKINRNH